MNGEDRNTVNPGYCYPVRAVFIQEPPEDLRKSNFFKFTVAFRGVNDELVDIESAKFVQYLNETHEMDLRNGIKYSVVFRPPNGIKEQRELHVTLIDAATREPIRYEGQDDSPKMKRVLLTHETICSRCTQQKSCGNRNEAPSDPVIVEKGCLKFFLKCNQNCLKGAGNPKDMRRFAMAISFGDITRNKTDIIAISGKMFVHNNSKHSRKKKKESSFDPCQPSATRIFDVFPKSGMCGTKIAIFGENFFPGIQVDIANISPPTEVVSDHVILCYVPYMNTTVCPINLRYGNQQLSAGVFHYEFPEHGHLACVHPKIGVRGEEFVIFGKELCSANVNIACNGEFVDTKIIDKVGVVAIIPPTVQLGTIHVGIYWSSHLLFWFRYQIQDPSQPGFSRSYGVLALTSNGQVQSHLPSGGAFIEFRMATLSTNNCYPSAMYNSSGSCASSTSTSPYTAGSYYNASSPEILP